MNRSRGRVLEESVGKGTGQRVVVSGDRMDACLPDLGVGNGVALAATVGEVMIKRWKVKWNSDQL